MDESGPATLELRRVGNDERTDEHQLHHGDLDESADHYGTCGE
jgi:hypothetical protein